MRILNIRRADDQEGATIVIVALCLIALFGMVVLVVDVGGLLLRRRELVNGSDAAALAAAKSCVLSAALDPRSAEQASDEWATVNVNGVTAGGTNIEQISGCDTVASGWVSVRYEAPQDLFFAPVLGYSNQGTVATEATAIWGPPTSASPLPLVIYHNNFNSCRLDTDPTPGSQCYIWEDNNSTQGSQSGFGFLDLRTDDPQQYGWGSDKGAVCTGQNADQWIDNYPDPNFADLGTNYPAPTYVCRLTGNQTSAWQEMDRLIDDDDVADLDDEEDKLFFPINRCYNAVTGSETDGQVNTPSTGSAPVACGNTPHQYDIIGFVTFKLKAIYTPNQVQPTTHNCPPSGQAAHTFPGATGLLDLDNFATAAGCAALTPQSVITVNPNMLTKTGGPGPQPVGDVTTSSCAGSATVDWCYDAAQRLVIWNNAGPAVDNQNYNVSFTYSNGGVCGIPPAGNNSGHCLMMEYVELALGGSGPGNGNPNNTNIRTYRLCEPTVASTCDPFNVPVP